MTLTISLLCSGRENTTEKCLASMRKLADGIGNSEIIVVDTGCDIASRKIIEKYADKIIAFEWCNDFSAARNIGVDAASGEWFMFIDDDEWFEDPSAIISFFTSGLYKKYTEASHYILNYKNVEMTEYTKSVNTRLFKLGDKSAHRFTGCIHEYFLSLDGPCYHIDCCSSHTGYIYQDESQLRAKSQRNVPLLQKMMANEPDAIRWPQHLVTEYYSLKDYEHVIELCNNTLEHFKGISNFDVNRIRPVFYCCLLSVYLYQRRYDDVKQLFSTASSDQRNAHMAIVRLCELAVRIPCTTEEDYEFVAKAAQIFTESLSKCDIQKDTLNNQIFLIKDAFNASNLNDAYIYGACSFAHLKDYDKSREFLNKIIWSDGDNPVVISIAILDTLDEIMKSDYNEIAGEIIHMLVTNNLFGKLAIERLFNLSNAIPNATDLLQEFTAKDLFLQLKLSEYIIMSTPADNWTSFDDIIEKVATWSQAATQYFSSDFQDNSSTIDAPSRVALELNRFMIYATEDFKEALSIIKNSIGIYPPLDETLIKLSKLYAEFIKSVLA